MHDQLAHRPLTFWAMASVLGVTLIHLWLAPRTELIPEEAYYWTYSQHPALSYFDHPPMVAWIIGLGTALFGNTELGVRAATIALWPGSALLLYHTGRLWFGIRAAALAVLLFCLTPVFVGIGLFVTPDAPLVFFWLLTLYALTQALHSSRSVYWWLAGLALGCAMLSKYTAVVLAASLVVFLCLSTRHRHWLWRSQPWLAALIALAVFSPVILWNAQHQWASFLFQSTRTVVENHDPRVEAGTFWLYQLGALTPLLLGFYVYAMLPAVRRGWLAREDRWNFAVSFALPLFFIFVLASFKNKGHINWTAPAYLSWSLAAAAIAIELDPVWACTRPVLRKFMLWGVVILCLGVNVVGQTSLTWGVPHNLAFKNAGGWRALADAVRKARQELSQKTGQQAFVIGGDKFSIAAELGFYLGEKADVVNDYALGGQGLGYRYWFDLQTLAGRPAITVVEQNKLGPYTLPQLRQFFTQSGDPQPLRVSSPEGQFRQSYLIEAQGYSGK